MRFLHRYSFCIDMVSVSLHTGAENSRKRGNYGAQHGKEAVSYHRRPRWMWLGWVVCDVIPEIYNVLCTSLVILRTSIMCSPFQIRTLGGLKSLVLFWVGKRTCIFHFYCIKHRQFHLNFSKSMADYSVGVARYFNNWERVWDKHASLSCQ